MENAVHKQLGPKEIAALSSVYIDRGVKQDAWEILEIDIDGALLKARIRMTSFFVSPTDPGGFHLTIFSTQEFLAQLANIYLHVAAGFETKCRETWMRECAISSRKVIRDPENIRVEIDFFGQKRLGDSLAAMANGRVYDDQGGLFTARLKGLLRA
jgi:hypothetical protein